MAEENNEICGFLDVKFFYGKSRVHKVKKKTLGHWRVWKRYWCSFENVGSGMGIKVHLNFCFGNSSAQSVPGRSNSIIIPLDAIICRTQSRSKQFAFGVFPSKDRKPLLYLAGNSEIDSQRWMANIRQLLRPRNIKAIADFHSISIIDNAHSKASGLTGLYGDLTTNPLGVFIRDVHTGEIIENFEWKELDQFHLATAGRPEDVKCICVVHTTREFRTGIGELYVFCLEAGKLLHDLVTQGRGSRHKQVNRRPFSLSEGDIRAIAHDELMRSYSVANERVHLRPLNKRMGTNERYEEIRCKVEDVHQPEPYNRNDRRCSNISTASGIYEEIPDELDQIAVVASSFHMERIFRCRSSNEPPPLPPRQRCASESMKGSRSQDGRVFSGPSTLPSISHVNSIQMERTSLESRRVMVESNYVPMSPRLKDIIVYNMEAEIASTENDYVIMR
ncbi:uncharacterized protein LOC108622274 [Ceratina calcarata]|uniref:Uncharacterized protein LOC108622274 n=1 Tax=Ceratina calcarata TaxID=156304 RepID=A0AAJ7N3U8_9HYME|nr:uncharacterized protein LOC108622274 [Ceratina calcarata]